MPVTLVALRFKLVISKTWMSKTTLNIAAEADDRGRNLIKRVVLLLLAA
jgi:hypothetical protein